MQLVKDLRFVVNKSLKEMSTRKQGRFMFFLAFSLLFGIISLLLIYAISTIIGFTLEGPIDFIEVLYGQNWFWITIANLLSPVYLVFILKYFETTGKRKKRVYQMGALFRSVDKRTFLFFLVSVVGLTLLYALYFFQDLGLGGFGSNLETMLNLIGGEGMYSIKEWISNVVFFILQIFPLLLIIIFGMTLNKSFKWRHIWSNRRSFLIFIFLYFVLLDVDAMLWHFADELIVHLVGIPFAYNAIPIFFGLLIRLGLTTVFTMVLSYFAYYSLQLTKEKKTLKNLERSERSDLLDDTI